MNVIVDTSVWSLALRRNKSNIESHSVKLLKYLITEGKVILLGAIRQEVLSGIRHQEQFLKLRDYLRPFPDLAITTEDYELAATFFNTCRSKGVQGSNTDFLICAVAHSHDYQILTTDQDFDNFKQHIPIVLL
jgi:predicted nucleic acid-binding protein